MKSNFITRDEERDGNETFGKCDHLELKHRLGQNKISFIPSTDSLLSTCCLPVIILSFSGRSVDKIDKALCSHGDYILVGKVSSRYEEIMYYVKIWFILQKQENSMERQTGSAEGGGWVTFVDELQFYTRLSEWISLRRRIEIWKRRGNYTELGEECPKQCSSSKLGVTPDTCQGDEGSVCIYWCWVSWSWVARRKVGVS